MSDETPPSRAERSRSFGGVADDYDRFRPGPAPEAVDWLLPPSARAVVDLGAGTGALTRLLVDRVPSVISVEPDERMRAVLAERAPSAQVLDGRGEEIPVPDASVDAVLASSSWHWMEPVATVAEVARVLRPRGVLGVVWTGPEWSNGWFSDLRPARLLARMGLPAAEPRAPERARGDRRLVLPPGAPFSEPERTEVRWNLARTTDDVVGLLGTYSGVITAEPVTRDELFATPRSYLREEVGLDGDATIDLPYCSVCWRAVLDGPV